MHAKQHGETSATDAALHAVKPGREEDEHRRPRSGLQKYIHGDGRKDAR